MRPSIISDVLHVALGFAEVEPAFVDSGNTIPSRFDQWCAKMEPVAAAAATL